MRYLIIVMLLVSGNALACDQQCISVLEIHKPLEKKVAEIEAKYPTVQAKLFMMQAAGQNPEDHFDQYPDLKNYYAEMGEAVLAWGKQMATIWPGPWSENNQIMLKMFEGALQRCQRLCY